MDDVCTCLTHEALVSLEDETAFRYLECHLHGAIKGLEQTFETERDQFVVHSHRLKFMQTWLGGFLGNLDVDCVAQRPTFGFFRTSKSRQLEQSAGKERPVFGVCGTRHSDTGASIRRSDLLVPG
jgi:hypothetical protein